MGGRREVSIIFYRPLTRSDLKQERSFFRGSVSSFLQLVVALVVVAAVVVVVEVDIATLLVCSIYLYYYTTTTTTTTTTLLQFNMFRMNIRKQERS